MHRLAVLSLFVASCGGPGGICAADELTAALAHAAAGSTVQIGACTITGAFVVPAGVSVSGVGGVSVLQSLSADAPVLDVSGGTTRIADLGVHVSHGGSGVRAVHASTLSLHGVDVAVDVGIGIGVEGGSLDLDGVTVHGPIVRTNAATASTDPTITGAWGVIARHATSTFASVHVSGFSAGAVAIDGGSLDWTDTDDAVDVGSTRGTGLVAFDAQVSLDGVELGDLFSGLGASGIAIASTQTSASSTPTLSLDGVHVAMGDGYGIVAFDTAVTLRTVSVDQVGLVGLQAQRGTLDAMDVTMTGNGGAGIALLDVGTTHIARATLSGQRMVSLPTDLGSAAFGDGLHVRRTTATGAIDLVVDDAMLDDNPRAGMLIDGDGTTPATLTLTQISASASSPGALGVIAQDTPVPSGWDSGVVRTGAVLANDAAFSGQIDTVGLLMPPTSLPGSLF